MHFKILLICALVGSATASAATDPAAAWLRADAPPAYLVRGGETEHEVMLRFVRLVEHWEHVWCPWPGYVPPPPLRGGDLLVQVQINGRTWIQRVRRAAGPRPHAVLLRAFAVRGHQPFALGAGEDALTVDPSTLTPHMPQAPVHTEVLGVLPPTAERAALARIGLGRVGLLAPGTALDLVDADGQVVRVLVVLVEEEQSVVLVLGDAGGIGPGTRVRSPGAWCVAP